MPMRKSKDPSKGGVCFQPGSMAQPRATSRRVRDLTLVSVAALSLQMSALVTGMGALSALTAVEAHAQSSVRPVTNRSRPQYDPKPIRLGPLELRPRVDANLEYVENIFVSDRSGSDAILLSILPGVRIIDVRQDRRLSLDLSAGYDTYLEGNVRDRIRVNMVGDATFGLGTLTRTFAGFDLRKNDSQFNSFNGVRTFGQPVELTALVLNAGLERDIGRLTLTGEGLYYGNEYDGDLVINGQNFDDPIPDRDVYGVRGRAAYNFQASRSVYTEAQYNVREFDQSGTAAGLPADFTTDLSSEDVSVRLGVVQRLTDLLQVDANLGFITRDFDNPALSQPTRFTFDAKIGWNPTRLTSVQLRAARSVDEFGDSFQSGLLRNQVVLSAQHELLRNLILEGSLQYSKIDSDLATAEGEVYGARLGARYLVSPKWSIKGSVERFERDTFAAGSQNRVLFGVRRNF